MKAWLKDLQKIIHGHVTDSADAREYFATDGSIFTQMPEAVLYPQKTADVTGTVKVVRDLADKGHKVSIVARGKGTDQAGGALGSGLMLVFPAHMNKIRQLDKHSVTVQPGLIFGNLEKTLYTHGRFIPSYPASYEFSTIGGAIANNSAGALSVKYGATRDYVKSLQVVLSDGSLIETKRLSPMALNRKKGQRDLEGEIYRKIDSILIDHAGLIKKSKIAVTKNAAGYDLWDIKGPGGTFDLSQLIVGSQGTLGIVTEATLRTIPYNSKTTLVVGFFDSLDKATRAVMKLLPLQPSALEVVDSYLLEFLREHKPSLIKDVVPEKLPKIVLLAEFDDFSQFRQRVKRSRTIGIFKKFASSHRVAKNRQDAQKLWAIRRQAADIIWQIQGSKKALPIIEDGVVPIAKMAEFLESVYRLLDKYELDIAVWGHAGNANFHIQPFLNLAKLKDQQKIYKLMDEFYGLVISMGGSTCGEHNDGLLRAPYLKKLYGPEMYDLFVQVKHIFDPSNILNPGKKVGVTVEDTKKLLRKEYSMKHLHDFLPHN